MSDEFDEKAFREAVERGAAEIDAGKGLSLKEVKDHLIKKRIERTNRTV